MTQSLQDLRERRAAKAAEARRILDDNQGPKWNAALADQVDALYNEIEHIERQIKQSQIDLSTRR